MGTREGELRSSSSWNPAAELARRMVDEPYEAALSGVSETAALDPRDISSPLLRQYDEIKMLWMGHPNRERRLRGEHPWIKREVADNYAEYRIPIFSGFSYEEGEDPLLLQVSADTHRQDGQPLRFLVAEHNLQTGRSFDQRVLSSSVDAARRLWIQLAPANYTNWSPGKHPALFAPRSEQIRIETRLDELYHAVGSLHLREGVGGRVIEFHDIEALEAMIIASFQRAHERYEAQIARQLGNRGVSYEFAMPETIAA